MMRRTVPARPCHSRLAAGRVRKQLCMLLPRWFPTHRQLRCALLLREFHATPTCLRMYLGQIDPISAEARIYSRHPKNNDKKSKKIREGKQKRRKPITKGRPSTPGKLSSLLRLQDNISRSTRSKVERPFGLKSRTLPGRLSRNKDIDGMLPYTFHVDSFSFASQHSRFPIGI